MKKLKNELGAELVDEIITNEELDESAIIKQRVNVNEIKNRLRNNSNPDAILCKVSVFFCLTY